LFKKNSGQALYARKVAEACIIYTCLFYSWKIKIFVDGISLKLNTDSGSSSNSHTIYTTIDDSFVMSRKYETSKPQYITERLSLFERKVVAYLIPKQACKW